MKNFNNMYIKIKSYFNSIYFLVLGTFWIALFIYFRFINKRSPYDLVDLRGLISTPYLLIHGGFILLHLFLICYAIYLIYNRNKDTKLPHWFIQKIQSSMEIILTKPLSYIKELIAPHIPYSGLFFCYLSEFLEKKDPILAKRLIYIFYVTPRIIVACIFFIELVRYQRISYFVTSLILLLLPLLWSLFVNLFISFGERCLNDIPKYIEVTPLGEPFFAGWHKEYSFRGREEYKLDENDVREYGLTWLRVLHIYAYGNAHFKDNQKFISPYITIVCSSLYLGGILYKLFFLII